jgi:transcriptional regulator with XRE-family HTH domain
MVLRIVNTLKWGEFTTFFFLLLSKVLSTSISDGNRVPSIIPNRGRHRMMFEILQARLILMLRNRIQNGDLTERRLARLTGISQPHIHNVLKGIRALSPEIADLLLKHLQLTIYDLLQPEETAQHAPSRPATEPNALYQEIPMLDGRVGPGLPFPSRLSAHEKYPFPASSPAFCGKPVMFRFAADPLMEPLIQANDIALLDQSEVARTHLQDLALYVVRWQGQALARRLLCRRDWLYLIAEHHLQHPRSWELAGTTARVLGTVVWGKVVWIGRQLCPALPPCPVSAPPLQLQQELPFNGDVVEI